MDPDLSETMHMAAVAFLHKQIVAHGEVRLTQRDFEAVDMQQAIKIEHDPLTDDIIFSHVRADVSKPVS